LKSSKKKKKTFVSYKKIAVIEKKVEVEADTEKLTPNFALPCNGFSISGRK